MHEIHTYDLSRLGLPKIEYNIFLDFPRRDPFVIPAPWLEPCNVFFELISLPDALDGPFDRFDLKVDAATQ